MMKLENGVGGWRALVWIGFAAVCLVLSGCSRDVAEQASDSDANGYLCTKCGEKFYTPRKVFASHCPKCKSMDVIELVAFVCPKDQHVTIVPRGMNTVPCEQCKQLVAAMKLPREKELAAWGAKEAGEAEVTGR